MVRITVPHYFDFGEDRSLVGDDLVRPEAWDALRTGTTGPFGLPDSRGEWERLADEQPQFSRRAEIISEAIDERGGGSIASYGVGAAFLERCLNRVDPGRRLVLGEYAPDTTERLREIFTEAEVVRHDLLLDPPLDADWHLFHRIDTELSNRQWRGVMKRFGACSIVVVATELIDFDRAIGEIKTRLRNRNVTRSGRIRNRAAFESLWRRTHDSQPLDVADLQGWVLTPRS